MDAMRNVSMALLGTAVVTLVTESTFQTKATATLLVRVSQESAPGMGDAAPNGLDSCEPSAQHHQSYQLN